MNQLGSLHVSATARSSSTRHVAGVCPNHSVPADRQCLDLGAVRGASGGTAASACHP